MGEVSENCEPLLHSSEECVTNPVNHKNTTPFVLVLVKWILKTVMWFVFVAWVSIIFLFPAKFVEPLFQKFIKLTSSNISVYGVTGSIFMAFSGPILVIAFLAILYIIISGEEQFLKKKIPKGPRFRLWTFPVLVDGPFGVVSAAELIGILLFIIYIIWAVSSYTLQNLKLLSEFQLPSKETCYVMLELSGLRFGLIGLFCLAFLFLPIARGSVLLRLIDIPFEHATKYHVWLGHLTMFLFTLHGLFYIIAWAMQGRLIQEMLQWKDIGVANLPGVISLSAGLLMWVTSLSPVRKEYFELFFYTHQLYVVFVIFLALHVGDAIFSISAGGIFLFMLDRFLRFCQSRKSVKVISATCLPSGTVELVISKPENLRYNALSFIFVRVRELSWLQWHPFSVSSSPLDGKYHISVLIKVLGKWTEKLRAHILDTSKEELSFQPYSGLTVAVEGPYGHESPYYLMYENLILVAGGIGISPFLAVLSDILHRIKEGKPCLPKNVLVVWAIKTSEELPLLSAIDTETIRSFSPNNLNLEISIYVTRESEPPLEEGKILKTTNSASVLPVSKGCGMSALVGTGNNIWSGIYVISSTIGFFILIGLLDVYYINPYVSSWWYKGLLFVACMTASVFIFGGIVIGLWHLWERRISASEDCEDDRKENGTIPRNEHLPPVDLGLESVASSTTMHYGCRPDFEEIFKSISEDWGHVDVGVIVCGPSTLQSSVAKECRSLNLKGKRKHSVFHFNSHSFDL